jgi:phosphonate transport system substrate-binding protein
MCAPSFLALDAMPSPPVVAVAAPVFSGAGVEGRPVYFSDVVVQRSHPARSIADLIDARWGYNDAVSLSGYHSLRGLVDLSRARHTGSHLRSLELVVAGDVDAAAIDSIVLGLRHRADPALDAEIRVVERLGPFPVQPVVCAASLPEHDRSLIGNALVSFRDDPAVASDLSRFGLERFVAVTAADYAQLLVK